MLAFSVQNPAMNIEAMISSLMGSKNLPGHYCVFLTIGKRQLPADLQEKFSVIHAGWLDDEHELARMLSTADLFLQPSLARKFSTCHLRSYSLWRSCDR